MHELPNVIKIFFFTYGSNKYGNLLPRDIFQDFYLFNTGAAYSEEFRVQLLLPTNQTAALKVAGMELGSA